MFATRLCLGDVKTCDETELRQHDGPVLDGRSAKLFARQNGGVVTQCLYGSDFNSFSKTNLRAHTIVCPRETEPLSTRQRA
eukprot:1541741-Pleurochrysis_carterae.AAC.2